MISILCHLYHTQTWDEINDYIKQIAVEKKLYVNLVEDRPYNQETKERIKASYPSATVIISPNQGRDCGGNLRLINQWMRDGSPYPFLIQCHSKTNPGWRKELMHPLFSEPEYYIEHLFKSEKVGMAGCARWLLTRTGDVNSYIYNSFCKRFRFNLNKPMVFVAGTMFCVRSYIFKDFFSKYNPLELAKELEYDAMGEPSKTHAWERLFGAIVLQKHSIVPVDYSRSIIENFNERFYLQTYQDVKDGIQSNNIVSAYTHFMAHGRFEGRKMNDMAFDEEYYLKNNPDVVESMKTKGWPKSGYDHFLSHGHNENRKHKWVKAHQFKMF